jgi:hypothetical protein
MGCKNLDGDCPRRHNYGGCGGDFELRVMNFKIVAPKSRSNLVDEIPYRISDNPDVRMNFLMARVWMHLHEEDYD